MPDGLTPQKVNGAMVWLVAGLMILFWFSIGIAIGGWFL